MRETAKGCPLGVEAGAAVVRALEAQGDDEVPRREVLGLVEEVQNLTVRPHHDLVAQRLVVGAGIVGLARGLPGAPSVRRAREKGGPLEDRRQRTARSGGGSDGAM